MRPLVSIVIVNYNGKGFITQCIESVVKQVKCAYEIILVDNSSTDGSPELVERLFPEVRLLRSSENLGFSKGNNLGCARAKGKYLLLLNQDTILLTDIRPAIEALENDASAGAVGAKMLGRDKDYRLSAGLFPTPLRMFRLSSLYIKDGHFRNGDFPSSVKQRYAVDWVEGSFVLTKSKVWKEAGGLDDGYFMYGEDVDFCMKLKKMGYSVLYCPSVSYIHFGSFSVERLPMLISGLLRFHDRHYGARARAFARLCAYTALAGKASLKSLSSSPEKRSQARACWNALIRNI